MHAEQDIERGGAVDAMRGTETDRVLRARRDEPEVGAQTKQVLAALLRIEESHERPVCAGSPQLDFARGRPDFAGATDIRRGAAPGLVWGVPGMFNICNTSELVLRDARPLPVPLVGLPAVWGG